MSPIATREPLQGREPRKPANSTGDAALGPQLIATLDRWISKPLCGVLTLVDAVRKRIAAPVVGPPERIVFVKLIEMGSTVLACPAFAEAERRVGRDNLFILVFGPNRAICDLLPFFPPENVIAIDDRGLVRFAWSLLRALVRTRRERIDTAIDMEGLTSSSAVITYLSGARRRVGFYNFTSQGPYRGRLFNRELNYSFQHHISRTFLALLNAAFVDPAGSVPVLKVHLADAPPELPRFEPDPAESQHVRDLIRVRVGSEARRIVILNPNCSDLLPLRRWPTDRFVDLGKQIAAEHPDVTLVITGAPSEQAEAAQVAAAIGAERAVSLAGHTSLRELLVLYSLAELLISNDSGPVHFAALTPVRVLALFGPETPTLYGPLGEGAQAISANLSCSPCVNILNHRISPCTDNQCMQRISVERVLSAAREQLKAS